MFVMVGLPAAGKTIRARELASAWNALRLTPDEWMIPLFGQEQPDGKRNIVEGRLLWLALSALRIGVNVVLDFGVWGRDERSALRALAASVGATSELVFPTLHAQIGTAGRVGALSNQFYNLMSSVGLVPSRSHQRKADGHGRDGRRVQNNLSFHSLRHTATSLMKNAGISPAIVQEFIGHPSKAISQHYTHIELSSLRQAADSLPSLV